MFATIVSPKLFILSLIHRCIVFKLVVKLPVSTSETICCCWSQLWNKVPQSLMTLNQTKTNVHSAIVKLPISVSSAVTSPSWVQVRGTTCWCSGWLKLTMYCRQELTRVRQIGSARPRSVLNIIVRSLTATWRHTGSRCNSCRTGVMCVHRLVLVMSLAAAYYTNYSHWTRLSVMLHRTELQYSRRLAMNACTNCISCHWCSVVDNTQTQHGQPTVNDNTGRGQVQSWQLDKTVSHCR